jgi:LPS-assembly lipoprotein
MIPLAVASCQVRPLYAVNSGVTPKLASVSFSPATTRVGQEVRNQLIFIAGRGAGEPVKPDYNVTLTVTAGTSGVLYLASSDTSQAGRTVVTAAFVLKNASDGKVLKAGSRSATALVDFPTQEFAKQRAIRDSEDRAAREAAELVGADLSAALSR